MDKIYLNTAACGLLTEETLAPTLDFYKAMLTDGSRVSEAFRIGGGLQKIREAVADFIHAPADNIAFLPNFSFGINSLVQSLKGTEKVMLYRHDFPSLLDPFKINNFDITWLDSADGFTIDVEAMKAVLIKEKIEVLAISHVQWLSGFKLDVEDLGQFCKENNIIYLVDATQSLGGIETDMRTLHCDALIASNYKWMNAGFGNGIMYISDAFFEKYPPVVGGFGSYVFKDGQFSYSPSARNYEPGHLNIHGLLILEAALKYKQQTGIQQLEQHNHDLTGRLLNAVKELPLQLLGPATLHNRSSIILARAEEGLHEHLVANNVVVSNRMGFIRISIHFHNTETEIDRLVELLRQFYSTKN